MIRRAFLLATGCAIALLAAPVPALAQDDEPIYGRQMMTERERQEYRARMRSAPTEAERERIRAEHHARMRERAGERGVTLPEEPPRRGMGMGQGQGDTSRGTGMQGRGRMQQGRSADDEAMGMGRGRGGGTRN